MTLIVVVIDAALDDIGHGLDPAMRVLAETPRGNQSSISAKNGSVAAKSPRVRPWDEFLMVVRRAVIAKSSAD